MPRKSGNGNGWATGKRGAVIAASDLSDKLRRWLSATHAPPPVQAAALAYETAALVGKHASTLPQAYALIDQWASDMKNQIASVGVGVDYP